MAEDGDGGGNDGASPSAQAVCAICDEAFEVGDDDLHPLANERCGHRHCRSCVGDYLRVSVAHGAADVPAPCPARGCDARLGTRLVHTALCDGALRRARRRGGAGVGVGSGAEQEEGEGDADFGVEDVGSGGCARGVTTLSGCDNATAVAYVRFARRRRRADRALRARRRTQGDGADSSSSSSSSSGGSLSSGSASADSLDGAAAAAPMDEATRALIGEISKPCPTCAMPVERAAGCDHVVCLSCKRDFCFKCGTDAYLSGTVFRKCDNCGGDYFDHRNETRLRIVFLLTLPLWLPLYLAYLALYLALGTAFCFFCCCCCCGTGASPDFFRKHESGRPGLRTGISAVVFVALFPLFFVATLTGAARCFHCFLSRNFLEATGMGEGVATGRL